MTLKNEFYNISVVIPCYNSAATINRALSSVCAQTIKPRELILVDDASSDNTLELLRSFSNTEHEFSVIVIKNDLNLGPGLSRNKAWDYANGDWISFLDSDDAWTRNKLEVQFNSATGVSFYHTFSIYSGVRW